MKPDTPQIRDRILAVLRDAERPLTTFEVCDRAGRYFELQPCREWRDGTPMFHDLDHREGARFVSCDGTTDTLSCHLNHGQRGLRELARFERLGQVVGYRERGRQAVLWALVESEMNAEVAALEEAFAAPSAVVRR